jgi:dihydrofolate reductase
MGRLIFSTAITVDGLMDVSDWFILDGDHNELGLKQLEDAEAIFLGRRNYEGLFGYWAELDGPWADRLNPKPKYVASRTLSGPLEWNSELLEGDAVEAVARLKEELDGDLLGFGCGDLTRQLVEAGLVDELRFGVHPAAWGEGARPARVKTRLELLGADAFDSGVLFVRYRPSPAKE